MGLGAGGDRHGPIAELGAVGGGCELREAVRGIGARPPRDGHAVGRVGSGGEDDPIGEPRGPVRLGRRDSEWRRVIVGMGIGDAVVGVDGRGPEEEGDGDRDRRPPGGRKT